MKINKINKKIYKDYAIKYNFFAGAILEITSICNFSCIHCYNAVAKKNVSFEDITVIANQLENMGVIYLTLTGGEILFVPNFDEIYLYLRSRGFIITLFTNLSLVKKHLEVLKKNRPFRISGSLYGLSELEYYKFTKTKGMFGKVKDSITQISDNNIKLELKVIVTKMNYEDVISGKYDRFIKKLDVDVMYDCHIFLKKDANESPLKLRVDPVQAALVQKLYSCLSKSKILDISPISYFCDNGNSYVYIDTNGNVSVCMKDFQFSISIFEKTENILKYIKRRAAQIKQSAKIYECNNCSMNAGCGWCPVEFEFDHEKIIKESYLCNVRNAKMKLEG